MFLKQLLFLEYLCCFFCLNLTLSNSFTSKGTVRQLLTKIPVSDRQILEKFFKGLVRHYSFGFTLWGIKPSVIYTTPVGFNLPLIFQDSHYAIQEEKGMIIWKKYQHLFTMKKFIFFDHFLEVNGIIYHEICLIHKEAFRELQQAHPRIFCKTNHPEKLIFKSRNSDVNHIQLGLFLGYGIYNSKMFQRIQEMEQELSLFPIPPRRIPYALQKINKAKLISIQLNRKNSNNAVKINEDALIKEYLSYNDRWIGFPSYKEENPLSMIDLPVFRVDKNSNETEFLYRKYLSCRKEISKILNQSNFLEIILEKFCEE